MKLYQDKTTPGFPNGRVVRMPKEASRVADIHQQHDALSQAVEIAVMAELSSLKWDDPPAEYACAVLHDLADGRKKHGTGIDVYCWPPAGGTMHMLVSVDRRVKSSPACYHGMQKGPEALSKMKNTLVTDLLVMTPHWESTK